MHTLNQQNMEQACSTITEEWVCYENQRLSLLYIQRCSRQWGRPSGMFSMRRKLMKCRILMLLNAGIPRLYLSRDLRDLNLRLHRHRWAVTLKENSDVNQSTALLFHVSWVQSVRKKTAQNLIQHSLNSERTANWMGHCDLQSLSFSCAQIS